MSLSDCSLNPSLLKFASSGIELIHVLGLRAHLSLPRSEQAAFASPPPGATRTREQRTCLLMRPSSWHN
eukprot:6194845-Pleurochrysis_carterae.AAC.1